MRLLLFSGLCPTAKNGTGTFITQRLVALRNRGIDHKCIVLEFHDTFLLKTVRKVLRKETNINGRFISSSQKAIYPYSLYEYRSFKRGILDAVLKHFGERRSLAYLKRTYEGKPDLIHAHWIYPNGFLAVRLGKILQIPVVVTAHGSDVHTNPFKNSRNLDKVLYTLENAHKVIFVSDALKRAAISFGYSGSNSVIIPNGVDHNVFKIPQKLIPNCEKESGEKRRYVVGFVGNLVMVKRAENLPTIFREIKDYIDARFVLVGDGPLREEILKKCLKLGLDVQFVGRVKHEEVAHYMNEMDALILPSRNEGWPCVILEAQACGVPVVGSDRGGIPEAVGDGGAIVSDGKDFEKRFAAEVVRVLQSSFDPEKLRARTLKYNWENIVDREILVYEECLSKK